MARGDLTDAQWACIEPHLPPQKPATGRPNLDHRTVINGIRWVLRTGSPWGDMPERYGKHTTVASRFYRWAKVGVWDRLLAAVQAEADHQDRLDWEVHFVDSTIVRAHQHAAGAKKGIPTSALPNRLVGKPSGEVRVAFRQRSICERRASRSRSY